MTSRRPLASVWSFIVVSLLMVSSSVTVFLLVKIARAAHVLVRVGAWRNGWCLRRSAVEPALNDGLNGLAMWCALASDRERAEASRVHALSAVFLRTANDAEHWPVAHLGLRVLGRACVARLLRRASRTSRPNRSNARAASRRNLHAISVGAQEP